jgi:transcriptional regulator with XRE-family HTH domain
MSTIGERIRAARQSRNLSQTKLAQRTGLTQKYISQLETRPQINPSADVLRRLESGLDLPPGSLLAAENDTYCPDDPAFHRLAAAWPALPAEKRNALATLAEDRAPYTTDPE